LNDTTQCILNVGTGGKRHCTKRRSGMRALDNTQSNEEGKAWHYCAVKRGKALPRSMHE